MVYIYVYIYICIHFSYASYVFTDHRAEECDADAAEPQPRLRSGLSHDDCR